MCLRALDRFSRLENGSGEFAFRRFAVSHKVWPRKRVPIAWPVILDYYYCLGETSFVVFPFCSRA